MKKIFYLVFFIFTSIFSQQKPITYDFFGGKSFDNNAVFFRLVFQINNKVVTGYMYTDERGNNETKSLFKGSIDIETNKITFSENRKLLTKSNNKQESACYLYGEISLNLTPKLSQLNGIFHEVSDAGLKCKNGKINLRSPDAYLKFKQQEKENTPIPNNTASIFNSTKTTTIKDDEEIIVFWESEKIILSIWDDIKEDGDRITITFNGKTIVDDFELKNKKKLIEINIKKQENKLVFTATDTGLIADNTARVDMFDNELKHQIITKLQLNKSVTVLIKKK